MASRRLALALTALALLTAAPLNAQMVGSANSQNGFPFGLPDGSRYQQVYNASNFASAFQVGSFSFFNSQYPASNLVSGTFMFYLSTTNKAVGALSADFNSNRGVDNTLFATYVLTGGLAPAVLTFVGTPFSYDPSAGNLLIDMVISGLSHSGSAVYFDSMNPSGDLFSRMHDFGTGFSGYGLVTEFNPATNVVPEPSTIFLLGTGLALLGIPAMRRRKEEEV